MGEAMGTLLLLLLVTAGETAQPPGALPVRPGLHEEVIVTAERAPTPLADTPAAVSVLTRSDLASRPADNLAELLETLPGLHMVLGGDAASGPILSARGFFGGGEVEYVLLLVDGVPVGDVESGLVDWRDLRASELERVEVLHGPGASLYGDTALGGVVAVFTRAPSSLASSEVQLGGGSFSTGRLEARRQAAWGPARYALSASGGRTVGFRDHSSGTDGHLRGTVSRGGPEEGLALSAEASRRVREEPGPLSEDVLEADRFASDALFRWDRERTGRARVALSARRKVRGVPFELQARVAARGTRFLRTLLLAAGIGDHAHRAVDTRARGLSVQAAPRFAILGREARLRTGIEAGSDDLETTYRAVTPAGSVGGVVAALDAGRARWAAFAMQDWQMTTRVRGVAGLRIDRLADEASRPGERAVPLSTAFSPHLGVALRFGPAGSPGTVFARLSHAFKAPALDQRFDPRPLPDFAGGTFTISNADLTPQQGRTVEAGMSRLGHGLSWQAALYRTDVDDEIDFDPASFRYANIGRSRHQGVEVAVRRRGRFSPYVAYTFTSVEAREKARASFQLKSVPRHLARGGMELPLPYGVQGNVSASYVARRFLDDRETVSRPAHFLAQARLARSFGKLRTAIDVRNALDQRYEALGYLLPDFRGGEVAYAYPGSPRELRVTASWSF